MVFLCMITFEHEDENIEEYLYSILDVMFQCVETGLKKTEGTIHGKLQLKRARKSIYQHAQNTRRQRIEKDYLYQLCLCGFRRKC